MELKEKNGCLKHVLGVKEQRKTEELKVQGYETGVGADRPRLRGRVIHSSGGKCLQAAIWPLVKARDSGRFTGLQWSSAVNKTELASVRVEDRTGACWEEAGARGDCSPALRAGKGAPNGTAVVGDQRRLLCSSTEGFAALKGKERQIFQCSISLLLKEMNLSLFTAIC